MRSVVEWGMAVIIWVVVTPSVRANVPPPTHVIWESEPRYERVKSAYAWAKLLPVLTVILPVLALVWLNKRKPRTIVMAAAINALAIIALTSCLWTTYVHLPSGRMNFEFKKGSPHPSGAVTSFDYSRPPEGLTAPELYVVGVGTIAAVGVVGFGVLVWGRRGAVTAPVPKNDPKRRPNAQPHIDDPLRDGPTSRDLPS